MPLNPYAHQSLNIPTDYCWFFDSQCNLLSWFKFISIFTLKIEKWVEISCTFSAMVRYTERIMTPLDSNPFSILIYNLIFIILVNCVHYTRPKTIRMWFSDFKLINELFGTQKCFALNSQYFTLNIVWLFIQGELKICKQNLVVRPQFTLILHVSKLVNELSTNAFVSMSKVRYLEWITRCFDTDILYIDQFYWIKILKQKILKFRFYFATSFVNACSINNDY